MEDWGSSEEITKLTLQQQHDRFNRWFDLGVAAFYFIIIFGVAYWAGGFNGKDILAFITPVVFYLLGMNSNKGKS